MSRVRHWAFLLLFYGGSVGFVGLAPLVALRGEAPLRRWVRNWARWHRWCARVLLRIGSRVEGIVPDRPVLVAARHEAMFETIELVLILDTPAIVMKAELARIPLWGWAARRYGMIAIDRAGSAAALREMTRAGKAAITAGRPVLIFPEGTRVPHGQAAPLRSGFAGLYRAMRVTAVPLAIDSGRCWPRGRTPRAGTITFRFGEPIVPGLKRAAIEAQVANAINALNPGSALAPPEIGV